jgi:acyl carrier protein/GNAT superfamily N-acetyltransferase
VSDEDTQQRLLRFMQEITPPDAPTLEPDTAIFATGFFDSLALTKLVLWVEETIGAPIDPTTFDLRQEWATVAGLAAFIAQRRDPSGQPAARLDRTEPGVVRPDRYEIVGYDPALKPQLLELQRHLWGMNDTLNAKYFAWKYEGNPYVREPHLYIALLDGRPVAMRGMYGSRWEGGTPAASQTILCAGDTVVEPDHRGRGLFTRIMNFALSDLAHKDIPYLFSLSTSPATRLGSLATGWRGPGPLPRMAREYQPSRWSRLWTTVRSVPGMASTAPWRPFERLDRYLTGSVGRLPNSISVAAAPRPEAMADLIRRIGHDGRIRHVRDTKYLDWRFRDPRSTYRFCFQGRDRLQAYLVLQASVCSSNYDVVRIVDWEGETAVARSAVLNVALGDLVAATTEVTAASFSPEDRSALQRVGFVDLASTGAADYQSAILVLPVAHAGVERPWRFHGCDLLDRGSWDLRQIYSDGG